MTRSLLVFDNAIKSEATRRMYHYELGKFLEWSKIKDADGLLQLKESFLQELLEDYLFYLKKHVSPNSIPTKFAPLELFLSMNSKVLNFAKVRKMFPQRVKPSGERGWTNEEILRMLASTTSKRNRALIHLLASAGCRIGAIQEIRIK